MKLTCHRKAIAMIELIFAIVVMGIVLLSIPMIVTTSTNSTYVALQQEAIALASDQIGMVLTREWDENNTDINGSAPAPVLRALGDLELNPSGTTSRRAGTPLFSSTRSFLTTIGGSELNASLVLASDTGDRDDIDDFNGISTGIIVSAASDTDTGDLIDENMTLLTTVSYIDDNNSYNSATNSISFNLPGVAAPNATSNIKSVQVNLTTTNPLIELSKNITLSAFSCNIGTYSLNTRSF